jgi:uncharacterized protein YrrD
VTTLKQLTKKPLYDTETGVVIGKAQDVLVDPKNHKIGLIVLSYGNVLETSVVCDVSAVGQFGNDSLTIPSISKLHLAIHDPSSLDELTRGISLRKRTVITPDGTNLGNIVATEIDNDGRVVNYRLRRPRLGRLRPTFTMKPDTISQLGEGVVIAAKGPRRSARKAPAKG